MPKDIYYISNGKMFRLRGGKPEELQSGMLESYVRRVTDAAQRSEWKKSGSGAMFTGIFEGGSDAASKVSAIRSAVCCLGIDAGHLIYSLMIDGTAGIYRKYSSTDMNEGIELSSGNEVYRDFDIRNGRMVFSSAFAGVSHIGVRKMGGSGADREIFTAGNSWDSSPVWSAVDADQIYFCSAGLEEDSSEEKPVTALSYQQIIRMMMESARVREMGPSAVCLLDIGKRTLNEVLADPKYDFLHPQSTPDGALWYLRRPYGKTSAKKAGGCLIDILLLPVRIIRAVAEFFNVFSVKYTGDTLYRPGDTRSKSESQMMIDGNLIDAQEALKENQRSGEENPGIIPRSWELHRRLPDGKDELIRRGVLAYRVREDGTVAVSNGSALLLLTPDENSGKYKETKLGDTAKITFIL